MTKELIFKTANNICLYYIENTDSIECEDFNALLISLNEDLMSENLQNRKRALKLLNYVHAVLLSCRTSF